MKKIFSLYFFALLFLLLLNSNAQESLYDIAFGGEKSVFINLGVDLYSEATPQKNITAYRVERKIEDGEAFEQVADISIPKDLLEFKERISFFSTTLDYDFSLSEESTELLWNKIITSYRLDSLGIYSNYLIIRLAAGAVYFDDSIQPNVKYQYRVSLIDVDKNPTKSILSNIISFPGVADLAQIKFVNSITYENAVQLKWEVNEIEKNPSVISVFRKELNEDSYSKISPNIVSTFAEDRLELSILDTSVAPDRVFQYYIMPYDFYGNPGKKTKEIFIGSYNFQQVPLPQNIKAVSSNLLGGIELSWQAVDTKIVKSIKVYKSEIYDSSFTQIAEIPAGDTSFVDINIEPMKKYFYYLQLVGPLEEASAPSAKVFGIFNSLDQPLPPYGLIGEPIPSGVKLTWNKNDNFTKGYYVYRGDPFRDQIQQISELIVSEDSIVTYQDTSAILSGKYTYAYVVRAENIGHILSDLSDTAFVVPGKKTQPMTPIDLVVIAENNSAKIFWNNMVSFDNTIGAFFVYRKEENDKEFVKLNDTYLTIDENTYTDTTVQVGKKYYYAVQSIDIFGNESHLSSPVLFTLEIPISPSPSGVTVVTTAEGIQVSWNRVLGDDIVSYKLYRYQRGQETILLSTLQSSDELVFTDNSVQDGELYFYEVTALNQYNQESEPSSEAGIRK